jgi:hypothetical protein
MKNQTCLPLNFVVKALFIFLLLMQSGFLSAQSFFFDNYSVKEGLGQSTVYDIVQDSRGYLWIGTNVGVSYFDGIRFRNYTYENGLANDAVQRIVEDKWGNIWFGHKGGAISRLKDDTIQFSGQTLLPQISPRFYATRTEMYGQGHLVQAPLKLRTLITPTFMKSTLYNIKAKRTSWTIL